MIELLIGFGIGFVVTAALGVWWLLRNLKMWEF